MLHNQLTPHPPPSPIPLLQSIFAGEADTQAAAQQEQGEGDVLDVVL